VGLRSSWLRLRLRLDFRGRTLPKLLTPTLTEALEVVRKGLSAAEDRHWNFGSNDATWDRNEHFWTSYIHREFILMSNCKENPREFETTFEAKMSWIKAASKAPKKLGRKSPSKLHSDGRRVDLAVWHPQGKPIGLIEMKMNHEKAGISKDIEKLALAIGNLGQKAGGSLKYGILCGRIVVNSSEKRDFKKAQERLQRAIDECVSSIKRPKLREFAQAGKLKTWESIHPEIGFWALSFE
jgi:hypothetical protein